jgi:hypothetical protein
MRRAITIAMTIEADSGAGLADLYRAGLAQIALALASGRHQGTMNINATEGAHPHSLCGVFTVEQQQHRQPTTTQELQQ